MAKARTDFYALDIENNGQADMFLHLLYSVICLPSEYVNFQHCSVQLWSSNP